MTGALLTIDDGNPGNFAFFLAESYAEDFRKMFLCPDSKGKSSLGISNDDAQNQRDNEMVQGEIFGSPERANTADSEADSGVSTILEGEVVKEGEVAKEESHAKASKPKVCTCRCKRDTAQTKWSSAATNPYFASYHHAPLYYPPSMYSIGIDLNIPPPLFTSASYGYNVPSYGYPSLYSAHLQGEKFSFKIDISKRKELTLMMHINCYTIRKTNTFGIIHMPLFKASCSVDPLCDAISVIHQLMACPKIPKKMFFFT